MKAKEYAKKIEAEGLTSEVLTDIALAFLGEAQAISKARRIKTNGALLAIFEEQELKWQALCRLVPGVDKDGFRVALYFQAKEIYEAWAAYRKRQGRPLPELTGLIT